jgi:hypothetical protein
MKISYELLVAAEILLGKQVLLCYSYKLIFGAATLEMSKQKKLESRA